MVFAGRWAGKQNLFVGYERSYPLISPEGYFYPSLDNLTELVSHVASPRKILVLVGGNSVLLGVGQKKDQLWTKELQRDLGPDFVVVNLAFRGCRPTEMGAVVGRGFVEEIYPFDLCCECGAHVDAATLGWGSLQFGCEVVCREPRRSSSPRA